MRMAKVDFGFLLDQSLALHSWNLYAQRKLITKYIVMSTYAECSKSYMPYDSEGAQFAKNDARKIYST